MLLGALVTAMDMLCVVMLVLNVGETRTAVALSMEMILPTMIKLSMENIFQ